MSSTRDIRATLHRRTVLQALLGAAALATWHRLGAGPAATGAASAAAPSVEALPLLAGDLTLYLGRGEGGLYEDILAAIRKRNPELNLKVRRGPSTALANTLVAEAGAGVQRADVFWTIDSSALGLVAKNTAIQPVPESLAGLLQPSFRYRNWVPVSGRIRTLAYHTGSLKAESLPTGIMALADSDYRIGWAPAYGAFQSFITAMRLLEGNAATRAWLQAIKPRATTYAGEFGVVMAVARGEVELGFANHYYTLRLRQGQPGAAVGLAFTRNDAGCLLNASGAAILRPSELAVNFVRHLLTREVQSYLAREAFEIPLVAGLAPPEGLPPLTEIDPPEVDLEALADLRPTLSLLRATGIL